MKPIFFFLMILALTSCTSRYHTLKEPNARVEFERDDFKLSPQVTATAKTTQIIGIDWQRLRNKDKGSIESSGPAGLIDVASIPVIGNTLVDPTKSYALFNLMSENPGYDVVFYPQYETSVERPILGIGFFKKVTTVKVVARLGTLE